MEKPEECLKSVENEPIAAYYSLLIASENIRKPKREHRALMG